MATTNKNSNGDIAQRSKLTRRPSPWPMSYTEGDDDHDSGLVSKEKLPSISDDTNLAELAEEAEGVELQEKLKLQSSVAHLLADSQVTYYLQIYEDRIKHHKITTAEELKAFHTATLDQVLCEFYDRCELESERDKRLYKERLRSGATSLFEEFQKDIKPK